MDLTSLDVLRNAISETESQQLRYMKQVADSYDLLGLRNQEMIRQLMEATRTFVPAEFAAMQQVTNALEAFRVRETAISDSLAESLRLAKTQHLGLSTQFEEAYKAATLASFGGMLGIQKAAQLMIDHEKALASGCLTFNDAFTNLTAGERSRFDLVFKSLNEEVTEIAKGMTTPWIDAGAFHRSFESIASLQSLSLSLRLPSFELEESEQVRRALGDWRAVPLSEEVFANVEARRTFYIAQGFNCNLTMLPEPAFTESLHLTSLWQPYPRATSENGGNEEASVPTLAEAVEQRMKQCYVALFRFERRVRSFLIQIMTDRYGRNWWKQRVPGPIVEEWRRKNKEAIAKGSDHQPLVEYADFTDYLPIMMRKDNWGEVFSQIFFNRDDLAVSFNRLFPLRLSTMHSREISKEDLLLLIVETGRIERAIDRASAEGTASEDHTDLD